MAYTNYNVTPLRREFADATGLRDRIATRSYALMNLLGSSGAGVLSKMDVAALIKFASNLAPADAKTLAAFVEFELSLQRLYGSRIEAANRQNVVALKRETRRAPPSVAAPSPVPTAPSSIERKCVCCGAVGGKPHESRLPAVLPSNVARFPVRHLRAGRGPGRAA